MDGGPKRRFKIIPNYKLTHFFRLPILNQLNIKKSEVSDYCEAYLMKQVFVNITKNCNCSFIKCF